jgi:hypothetical protein
LGEVSKNVTKIFTNIHFIGLCEQISYGILLSAGVRVAKMLQIAVAQRPKSPAIMRVLGYVGLQSPKP